MPSYFPAPVLFPRGLKFYIPFLFPTYFLSNHQINFYNYGTTSSIWSHKSLLPPFHWEQPQVFNLFIGNFILFHDLVTHICVAVIMGQTRKIYIPHSRDVSHGSEKNGPPYPSGAVTWWGCPFKNMFRLGQEVHNLEHLPVDEEV